MQNAKSILEKAFRENAYPCRSEKARLAERTGLKLRQIHVWVSRQVEISMAVCSQIQVSKPSQSFQKGQWGAQKTRLPSVNFPILHVDETA